MQLSRHACTWWRCYSFAPCDLGREEPLLMIGICFKDLPQEMSIVFGVIGWLEVLTAIPVSGSLSWTWLAPRTSIEF